MMSSVCDFVVHTELTQNKAKAVISHVRDKASGVHGGLMHATVEEG